jgi:type VI protein secretion system component Hcp
MATKKTTRSKKLGREKKIEQRRPLKGVEISPFSIKHSSDMSSPKLMTN